MRQPELRNPGLRVRYEGSDERVFTFAMLACSAILFNTLQQPPW
jgi:hypothetical protein